MNRYAGVRAACPMKKRYWALLALLAVVALDAATGQPLVFLDREVPPPNVVDGLTTAWYFDPAHETVYSFISGGIAGFHNRMASLMRFPHDAPTE